MTDPSWPRFSNEEIFTLAREVVAGKARSYVGAAQIFARYILAIPHAPTCASFDFDPEKQLGSDKACDCR